MNITFLIMQFVVVSNYFQFEWGWNTNHLQLRLCGHYIKTMHHVTRHDTTWAPSVTWHSHVFTWYDHTNLLIPHVWVIALAILPSNQKVLRNGKPHLQWIRYDRCWYYQISCWSWYPSNDVHVAWHDVITYEQIGVGNDATHAVNDAHAHDII